MIIIKKINCIIVDGIECPYQLKDWPDINGDPARKDMVKWDGSKVVLKSNTELLQEYKKQKLKELKDLIRENWIDIDRTIEEIKVQIKSFNGSLDTKNKVDTAYEAMLLWLGL